MRLNSFIKENIKRGLIHKAFPSEREDDLRKNLRLSVEMYDELLERKKIYEVYPGYIRGSSRVSIRGKDPKDPNHNRLPDMSTDVIIPFTYALDIKNDYWSSYYEIDLRKDEVREKVPQIYKDAMALFSFLHDRDEFSNKLDRILDVVQSSTPLLKILPEAEEFLSLGASPKSGGALIDQSSIMFVRDCLNKEN